MKLTAQLALGVLSVVVMVLLMAEIMAVKAETRLIELDLQREVRVLSSTVAVLLAEGELHEEEPASLASLLASLSGTDSSVALSWHPVEALSELGTEAADARRLGFGQTISWLGPDTVVALAPVRAGGELVGVLRVTDSARPREAFLRRTTYQHVLTVLAISIAAGAAALALGYWLVGARINALRRKIEQVGAGILDEPLLLWGNDELNALGLELEEMSAQLGVARADASRETEARLRAERMLRHADRLTTVGQLAAGVAHELGTPLNVIDGRAAMLLRRLRSDEDCRDAAVIRKQAERVTDIIRRMLSFSRRAEPALRRADLGEAIRDSCGLLQSTAMNASVSLDLHVAKGDLEADFDPVQIQQLVTNLVLNAVQASQPGQVVSIAVWRDDSDERPLHLRVSDDGTGIPTAILALIYDPFYTTKDPGVGTGLGLSIVQAIVRDHDGMIRVESEPGEGTVFTIDLWESHP